MWTRLNLFLALMLGALFVFLLIGSAGGFDAARDRWRSWRSQAERRKAARR